MNKLKKILIVTIMFYTWQLHASEDKCMAYAPIQINSGLLTFIPYHRIIKNDFDCDGILDSLDSDIDGDGVSNHQDAFPRNSEESYDSDGDGVGDNADRPVAYTQNIVLDVENDGITKTVLLKGRDNDSILYYTIVKYPKHGTLTGNGSSFTYVADKGYNGTDSFTFKVNDGDLDSSIVPVSIYVRYLPPVIGFSDKIHGLEPWAVDIYGSNSHLLKDINQREESSNPSDFTVAGDKLYFTADDGIHGEKLWMSSGVNGNADMIKDGIQNPLGSDIQNIIELDGKVFFTSGLYKSASYQNALQGMLYMSVIGSNTAIKIDENPDGVNGRNSITSDRIAKFNHKLFYYLNNALNSYDPETGTKEIVAEGSIFILDQIDDTLYFVKNIYDGHTLTESVLYKRTNNQNTIIKSFSTYLGHTKVVDDKLFIAHNSSKELWVYSKTENNIKMLKSFSLPIADRYDKDLVSFNGKLYFIGNDVENGETLWVSDGTTDGTKFFKDINHEGLTIRLKETFVYNDKFYFVSGGEPWVCDGTESGTKILEIRTGIYGSYPKGFTAFNNKVYFEANNGNNNLYVTDGTESGTEQVTHYTSKDEFNIGELTAFNNHLFFYGQSIEEGKEVWKSDGTESGTVLFANISRTTKSSSRENTKYTKMGQYYYFSANDGNGHRGMNYPLWRTDGTSTGTTIVKNSVSYHGMSPSYLTVVDDKLFFSADTSSPWDVELWVSDGTQDGTHLLKDINTKGSYYDSGSYPTSLTNIDGTLVFIAKDAVHGYELWRSDGTEEGTVPMSNFEEDDFITRYTSLIYMNGAIYFKGKTATAGEEFYKFNIATGKASLVKAGLSQIEEMTLVGDTIYFKAYHDSVSTKEIWKSDGTENGTSLLKKIQSGKAYNTISKLKKVGNKLFFKANDGEHGKELWMSDGTENGTKMLKDITAGDDRSHSDIDNMLEVSGKLYFTANDSIHGKELWISDGTEVGTHLVKDIMAGNISSLPFLYQEVDGKLLFSASDENGAHIWTTDGTEEGTKIVGK